ncbi:phenylalanine--tRNA ligase subunit alpha [Candidatus Gillettellia adelgis]
MLYIAEWVANAKAAIEAAQDVMTLDVVRVHYLGKNGNFTLKIKSLRDMPAEKRPEASAIVYQAKRDVQNALKARQNILETATLNECLVSGTIDVSLPGRRMENGGLHPVTRTINRIETFFAELGFSTATGPEIEDNYHNFDALNIPWYHPARADYDTFWFDDTRLLRTQTSGVQVRTMKNQPPPIRMIASGRVYRKDYDQIHTPMFHQIEGLIVDKDINLANLKGMLHDFLNKFFEKELQVRFRPSYFPFTKPSAEIEITDKNGKWLEVLGCGMVHPNVLKNVGINPEIHSGFAFGMGVERLTMLRYSVTDLRAFFENDVRFLKQFK